MTDDMGEMDRRAEEQRKRKLRAPKGEKPEVRAPDITNPTNTGGETDKHLADVFYRDYEHLFCYGDKRLHFFIPRIGLWVAEDAEIHVKTYVMQLSKQFIDRQTAAQTAMGAATEAGNQEEADRQSREIAKMAKLVKYCEKGSTINTVSSLVLNLARTRLMESPTPMNPNPELLSCKNGVVDLATGELRWGRVGDYLTRNTGVDYVPDADYSWWQDRVLEMCDQNTRLAEYLQVWFGYCATGYTRAHCMTVMYGTGRNGKNVLMDSVASALGNYAMTLPNSFLEQSTKDANDNNQLYAMAQLHGVRFAYVSETGEKGRMRESLVKSLTGDTRIKARVAYGNYFEWEMTHKFTVGTNHKPEISGTDDGVWERLRLMPMRVKFGSAEEVAAGLARYLKNESLMTELGTDARREQVLRWIVDGARKYLKHDLKTFTPAEVAAETQAYRREQDVLGTFLQYATVHVPLDVIEATVARIERIPHAQRGKLTYEEQLRVDTQELWRVYVLWCTDNGHYPLSSTMFARRITAAQRFWPGDGAGEQLMRPLEAIRTNQGRCYVYVRWSGPGAQMLAQARQERAARTTKHTSSGADPEERF